MLDLAYVEEVGECVDNSFDATKTYAGLYSPKKWYKWTDAVPQWQSGKVYALNSYVYSEGIFYQATTASGLPSVGTNINEDGSATWTVVYNIPTWTNGNFYPAGSFVKYDKQLYYTVAARTAQDQNTADGISIKDDNLPAPWVPVDSTWRDNRLYAAKSIVSDHGMLFRTVAGGTSNGSGVADDVGVTWVRLNEGYYDETSYETISDVTAALPATASGEADYKQDSLLVRIKSVGAVQSGVTTFVATGNFLNWASASKFDIQKKILTGGKYNDWQDELVSQGRGCSSRGFIKEVPVNGGTSVITFSIGGAGDDDWIDSTDETTRISILGVSTDGFIGSPRQIACQTAIDEVAKGENASLGTIQTNVKTCLDYGGTNNVLAESNAAYNHSVQSCWSIVKKGYTKPSDLGNLSDIYNACQHIYDSGIPPVTIDPNDSGYMCYGIYNSTVPDARVPTGTGSDRAGYIGRCWESGNTPVGCLGVTCNTAYGPNNDPRCFGGYLYDCTGNLDKDGECPSNKKWVLKLEDDPAVAGLCDTSQLVLPGAWTNDVNPNTAEQCVQEALWDYCGSLKIPEVIDPSDQIFNTGETWGMVGAMIDSGVVAMFGTDRPLIVMKGYLKQTTAPQGVLHEVKKDLRMGAMAFNSNGAYTECQDTVVNSTIVKYCPDVNRDGAKIIAPIRDGIVTTASGKTHVEDLALAINDIRATAWTPLAEAMFNALGYYGQNTNFRIDPVDFKTAGEDATFEDPVQFWCQDNYVLMITEGASTADINPMIPQKINTLNLEDPTVGVANEGQCLNEDGKSDLYGSTFLDDLTYFGQKSKLAGIYSIPALQSDDGVFHDKQNIATYMVVTGVPRDNGTTSECNPATIMKNAATNGGTTLLTGEDPAQLEANLRTALSDILFRTSAGSAASVISSSRSGEGGVYQAIFWPKIDRGIGKEPLSWAGDVHAFFIDEHGLLWDDFSANNPATKGELWSEDTNGNGVLDDGEDFYPRAADGTPTENGVLDGDRRVITFFNEITNSTQVCFNSSVITTGTCVKSDYAPPTPAVAVELRDFDDYLWSAKVQLDTVSNTAVNRTTLADGTWNYSTNSRYIFTWNDLDNDGRVDSNFDGLGGVDDDGDGKTDLEEVLPLVPGMNAVPLSVANAVQPRNSFLSDFNVADNTEFDNLINWLRGDDVYETDVNGNGVLEPAEDVNKNGVRDYIYRCRKYPSCEPTAVNSPPWRLGDVIHSTPTLVARPAEGYHLVYNDQSYATFYKKYVDRRHVIYFGGNDGMLHAINGGFYQAGLNKFLGCREDQRTPTNQCSSATPYNAITSLAYPALGDELWAYVPYNLQPHLKCLSDPAYVHKYFVDAPPRVFDVRIFPDDAVHPGGWGTILVGYMRFGGAPTLADTAAPITDNREFISAYFVLDVTDPERPPKVLAEMTMTTDKADHAADGTADEDLFARMGYTTGMPSVVAMRNDLGNSEWFLVIGNGPTTVKGTNPPEVVVPAVVPTAEEVMKHRGKVATIPLNALTGVNWAVNGNGNYNSTSRKPFRIPNTEPKTSASALAPAHFGRKLIDADNTGGLASFIGDMVTVDFDIRGSAIPGIGAPYKTDAVYFGTVDGADFDATGTFWDGDGRLFRLVTRSVNPSTGKQAYTYPESWQLKKLLDAHGPIAAAPNIGHDGSNFWIYFGTGRFYAPEDKTDTSTQYFFGVKEPFTSNCETSWNEVEWWLDGGAMPIATNPGASPGSQGLFRSDLAKVIESDPTQITKFNGDFLYCYDGANCSFPQLTPVPSGQTDAFGPYYAFSELEQYIKGETCGGTNDTTVGIDGWYREFTDLRERSLGMPTLLGGLVTYTSYRPFADLCQAEGVSYLYGVYYLTGTAWHESVFGTDVDMHSKLIVRDRLNLGKGLATTPSLQTGGGPNAVNAYIQTSTGEIVAVGQQNLPLSNFKSGRTNWRSR
ncbi:MAG: hypothetical protein OEL83_18585 [Desulforhopalus sp.]|nr:hypothetical protein [Desulforhopalus sp.]